jgi:hypothetical protein
MGTRRTRGERFESDSIDAQADVIVGHLDERSDWAQELAERCFLWQGSAVSDDDNKTHGQPSFLPVVETLRESPTHCDDRSGHALSSRAIHRRLSFHLFLHLIHFPSEIACDLYESQR